MFRGIDLTGAIERIELADRLLVTAGVLQLALQPALAAIRWRAIVQRLGAQLSLGQSLRLTYVSTFLNQIAPGGFAGDAARAWLAHRAGHMLAQAINGVAFDRIISFVMLAVVGTACTALLPVLPGSSSFPVLLIALLVSVVAITLLGRRTPWLLRYRVTRPLARFTADALHLIASPRAGAVVIGLSALSQVNLCASLYLFARAFDAQLDTWTLAIVMPPVIFASSIPISVGGWGTREFAIATIMAALSVAAEPAVLASIAFGFAGILICLPGAFLLVGGVLRPRAARAADMRNG